MRRTAPDVLPIARIEAMFTVYSTRTSGCCPNSNGIVLISILECPKLQRAFGDWLCLSLSKNSLGIRPGARPLRDSLLLRKLLMIQNRIRLNVKQQRPKSEQRRAPTD
jgi:hypothetical protein